MYFICLYAQAYMAPRCAFHNFTEMLTTSCTIGKRVNGRGDYRLVTGMSLTWSGGLTSTPHPPHEWT